MWYHFWTQRCLALGLVYKDFKFKNKLNVFQGMSKVTIHKKNIFFSETNSSLSKSTWNSIGCAVNSSGWNIISQSCSNKIRNFSAQAFSRRTNANISLDRLLKTQRTSKGDSHKKWTRKRTYFQLWMEVWNRG